MYLYLYAPFLKQKKYARDLALIEGRITDYGITGKISQLSQFLKFASAIKEFGVRKLSTLVVVGDDVLLEEAINACALSPVVLGYIPMVEQGYKDALGLSYGAQAVDVLAARRVVKLDLGRIQDRFFLGEVCAEGKGLEVHTPTFSIFPKDFARVEVVNLGETGDSAVDGQLDIRLKPYAGSFFKKPGLGSVVHATSCRIKSVKPLPINCGGAQILKTPIQIDIVPEAIRMVLGRSVSSKANNKTKSKKRK